MGYAISTATELPPSCQNNDAGPKFTVMENNKPTHNVSMI